MILIEVTSSRLNVYATDKKSNDLAVSRLLYINLTNDEVISKKKKMTRYQHRVVTVFWDWFSYWFWEMKDNFQDTVIQMEVDDLWLKDVRH